MSCQEEISVLIMQMLCETIDEGSVILAPGYHRRSVNQITVVVECSMVNRVTLMSDATTMCLKFSNETDPCRRQEWRIKRLQVQLTMNLAPITNPLALVLLLPDWFLFRVLSPRKLLFTAQLRSSMKFAEYKLDELIEKFFLFVPYSLC